MRALTGTDISSPRIHHYGSSCTFHLKAHCLAAAERATLILLLMAEFFGRKHAEMFAVRPGQVRVDLPVGRRELVSELTSNRGALMVAIKRNFNVNVVSPKAYSAAPVFTVIGQEVSVCPLICFCCLLFAVYSRSLISSFSVSPFWVLSSGSFCLLLLFLNGDSSLGQMNVELAIGYLRKRIAEMTALMVTAKNDDDGEGDEDNAHLCATPLPSFLSFLLSD